MSAYYSSQTTIEAKVKALRVTMWGDKDGDGSIDPDTLTAALVEAKGEILAYIDTRYGSTITDAWDSTTRPDMIGTLSDWMTLYHLMSGSNVPHPIIVTKYEEAVAQLLKIADYSMTIPGINYVSGEQNVTTRARYLECSEEDSANGYCDPCSYEYI